MKKEILKNKDGYTIIETMIAVSVFLVVIMTGLGALLNANFLHKKSSNTRSIMDNLSFVMEDMSRNLRTGYNYHCIPPGSSFVGVDVPLSSSINNNNLSACGGVAFEQALGDFGDSDDQWVYYIGPDNSLPGNPLAIWKSIESGSNAVKLNPNEIVISDASSFSVLGAEAPEQGGAGDTQQPFVTIRLSGEIIYKDDATPFALQTSVSQRLVDVYVPPTP